MVVFACKRKLIKSRLVDGLKLVTKYLPLNRPEKQLSRSSQSKTSSFMVIDVSQSSIDTFSTLCHCVMSGRVFLGLLDGPVKGNKPS